MEPADKIEESRKREKDSGPKVREEECLKGLRHFQNQGVSIVIDGQEAVEQEWSKIFEVREDDSFYMADYISDERTGRLKEIRFDRVYHR